jgi:hypothetical protein
MWRENETETSERGRICEREGGERKKGGEIMAIEVDCKYTDDRERIERMTESIRERERDDDYGSLIYSVCVPRRAPVTCERQHK